MGVEQLLETYSKHVKVFPLNTHDLRCVLDDLSHIPITRVMFVGMAGIAGMFMGQSISALSSASLPDALTTSMA